MSDRSKMMTRKNRHTLIFQVGGLGVRLTTLSCKKFDIEKNSEMPRRGLTNRRQYDCKEKDMKFATMKSEYCSKLEQ